jgi:hypothetical protein
LEPRRPGVNTSRFRRSQQFQGWLGGQLDAIERRPHAGSRITNPTRPSRKLSALTVF